MEVFRLEEIYGYTSIAETQRLENGEIILGCITTRYGRNGEIISQIKSDTMRVYALGKAITIHEAHGFGAKF